MKIVAMVSGPDEALNIFVKGSVPMAVTEGIKLQCQSNALKFVFHLCVLSVDSVTIWHIVLDVRIVLVVVDSIEKITVFLINHIRYKNFNNYKKIS